MAKKRRGAKKPLSYREAPKWRVMGTMAAMALAGGDAKMAEGYLLELLAFCAFADRDEVGVVIDAKLWEA